MNTKKLFPSEPESYAMAQEQLDQAAEILELEDASVELLSYPLNELSVAFPVRMDDGEVQILHGFRVQHNNALGPFWGGLRFHVQETIDRTRARAMWMTWMTALLDLPLGGARGGVSCNIRAMSNREQERMTRGYTRRINKIIGDDVDIISPDTNAYSVMTWANDEHIVLQGRRTAAISTGWPTEAAAGQGIADAGIIGGLCYVREAIKSLGSDTLSGTVAIQGYGNAGANIHRLATQVLGSSVVAVSDSSGGIYSRDGLGHDSLARHKLAHNSVITFPEAEIIDSRDVLGKYVDVLFAAAGENQLTAEEAHHIKARVVVEVGSNTITPEGEDILYSNGTLVIPAFLFTSGSLATSYLGWVQSKTQFRWDEETIVSWLKKRMGTVFMEVNRKAQSFGIEHRSAAYLVGIERVAIAIKSLGWV